MTQTHILWIFKKDPKKEIYTQAKALISDLIGTEDCIISHATIQKDAVVLAIHNQLHILSFNRNSLASASGKINNDLVRHKIIKMKTQIQKLWSLNDYNILMIQYYSVKGLHIYRLVDQLKEIKNISNVFENNIFISKMF